MNETTAATASDIPLMYVYHGWDGYQKSLMAAVAPLTPEQLEFRPAPNLRSVGELVRHLALGRLNWFVRMDAPTSATLAERIPEWVRDDYGNRYIVEEAVSLDRDTLLRWLGDTGKMIAATLNQWNVAELTKTYRHTYWGKTYAVSRQWTIWRIVSHDIHHGGQLGLMLQMQSIEVPELVGQGGHIVELPLAADD